jgi:hypothetical protein
LADPEQAIGVDKLMAMFSYGAQYHAIPRPLRKALPFVALAGGLFLLWRLASLRNAARIGRVRSSMAKLLSKLGL